MRHIAIAIVIAAAVFIVGGSSPRQGRFVIHSGYTSQTTPQGSITCPAMIRMNTETGQTWIFTDETRPDGTRRYGWGPLPFEAVTLQSSPRDQHK